MNFCPLGVCWNITHECNYHCPFCYANKNSGGIIDIKKQKEVISKLKDAGVYYLSFTGGEPTLVKHLPQLIGYAKILGMHTELCTNASFLDKKIIAKIKNSVDEISIPLDGSNDKIISQIRNVKSHRQTFDRVISLIKNTNIKLNINTLVCNFNKDDLINILQILKKIQNIQRWKLIRYYPIGKELNNFTLSVYQFRKIISKIIREKVGFEITTRIKTEQQQF